MKARDAALKTLVQISKEQAFSNLEVNKLIKENKVETKDKGLYITLVYGTLQHLISIDYVLESYIKRGLKKLQQKIQWILRIAVYQILFLDSIPDYAIVNEAVNQTKKCNRRLAGLVNGTLKNIIRNRNRIKKEIEENSNKEIKYSLPEWIIDKYLQIYQDKTDKILDRINDPPDLFVRVKPNHFKEIFNRLEKLGAQPKRDDDLGDTGIIINNPKVFKNGISGLDLFQKGLITVQDKGAIQIGLALNPKPDEDVLDICAAPGGKTTHIAELMKNTGNVDAFDLYEHRCKLIVNNANRLNLNNINVITKDATVYDPNLKSKYDRVLVDAPCSGLGIIRRKPEIRYNTDQNEIKELQKIQYKILDNAFSYLKEGGTLVYSTCTVNPDENEKIIQQLKKNVGEKLTVLEENQTSFLDNSDGFYYAVLKKNYD